jgi:SAM-dependent methyltransferase
MSLIYKVAYCVGFRPWEDAARGDPAPRELLELLEGSYRVPVGKALDLGCGSGSDPVFLASRGWQVTGVELETRAITEARDRARVAGVPVRFLQGDVTRLEDLGVGTGFTFVLDVGCFHTLPRDRRGDYVRSVTAAAAPDATMLLFAFASGASPGEIRSRFADDWNIEWERPGAVRRFLKPYWYRLRRRSSELPEA